ncbi:MAG: hypothetical protein WAS07_12230 [Micropruina sp.]
MVFGAWAPVLAYAVWLAVNAALYSTLTMCALVLVRNRVLALTLPWIAYLAAGFALAVTWLEAYSVLLAFPFNLTQLPLTNLLYPLAGLSFVVVLVTGFTLAKAPTIPQLQ